MAFFLSDEEFDRIISSGDASLMAEKADSFIRGLFTDLETVKAEADASAITAEQTCSLLEQKYISLSQDYSSLESSNSQLNSSLEQRVSELAQVQADKHQLHLKLIEKDGEIERLSMEVKELQKSKRQLMDLVGVKDVEIREKNSIIKSYLDKITDLSDRSAQREARLSELDAEVVRCRANCDKLAQEKELIEKHNVWLNDELTAKVDSLLEQRRRSAEIEADMSTKLADMEKQYNECASSLSRQKERVRELETKLESLHRELCSAKDDAAATEQRYSAEIKTVSKLVDLYKESSEEWSKKSGELEGVIKALETHLSQVESDYKDKLEKEASAREDAEKEFTELKDKLAKCEADLEASRKAVELNVLPLSSFNAEDLIHAASGENVAGDTHALVPHVPAGVSGTALALSLMREGWSLAKMYARYQEAADALRHEQLGRKQTQAILERVLIEIEEKASVIMDERAEHERMAEAYALMNQKLQQSLSEQATLERVVREMKADLQRREREYGYAEKEIADLEKQVAILLKECRDIQLRCGSMNHEDLDDEFSVPLTEMGDESDAQKVISEHLISIKDIKGLVEQNAKLRSLVRSLSDEVDNKEKQLKEQFEEELQKHKEDAASKVAAVLERAEDQGRMIESLHSSVAMYRRLYEEEHRLLSSHPRSTERPSADGRKDFMLLLEGSQDATKRSQEQAIERVRCLEEELAALKAEIISMRSERDKLALEANFSQEKLERFMKEFDQQREEMNGVLARNIEFSRLIVDYQKKLRESSESQYTAEELTRKLNMEVSVLKREKELLLNSEKRAQDEVRDLSQRLHRVQATLDTIQSAEQVREEARVVERKKQEAYIKQIEKEWAEAKKELQEERNNVRTLSLDREHTIKDAMRQVEDLGKELAAALQAVTAAETRAAVAEARCSDLERNLKSSEATGSGKDGAEKPSSSSETDIIGDLRAATQEIERLKAEAQANKDHMLQYKSIAEVNEAALKQMEKAHESFKSESEQLRNSFESEILSLRNQLHELEKESTLKVHEAVSAASQKDEAFVSALAEISSLKEENSNKVSQVAALEVQITVLKEELENEHQRAHAAQANYERQVILQSETIQELTRTSQALASLQEEASKLRTTVDAYKSENVELKANWEADKLEIEKLRSESEKKHAELDEQNRILHSQLEAMHIKIAERDRAGAGVTPTISSADTPNEAGLHSVVSYLRRSKEIAETEISLLKQEKLRLQTQLERSLKAAEAAEASRSEERTNSRNLLFTEDEFKALKLQVGEINLLRESNLQLREENKHNFEECQKMREVAEKVKIEAENMQNLLRERELEAETLRKEIEVHRKEKEHLEQRISQTLERSMNIDLEDYNRLKSEVDQLQASIKEKDAVNEEMRKLVSDKEGTVSKLELEVTRTKSELTERENQLLHVEAQKSEYEKQRKIVLQLRRRADLLSKDKDSLSKEKESLLKERESLTKEKEALLKEKESLSREKEELSKEKQAVSRQLDDQMKKSTIDVPVDLAQRDKEKEKETRIQILENLLGKVKDDHKKEREKRASIEKAIVEKVKRLDQERKKFEDEQGKHKEAVKKITDELERLKKYARDDFPEGTSAVQLLSGSTLDDMASTYVLAIEKFEREAHAIVNDAGNQASSGSSSAMDVTPTVISTTSVQPAEMPSSSSSMAPPTGPPEKAAEEREKVVSLPKTTVETRKTGRKLVRPRLVKTEESQRDVEVSELDGSRNAGKPALAQEMATQSSVPVSAEPHVRKRPASPSASELPDESSQLGDTVADVTAPALKRSKGSEFVQEDAQGQSATENVEIIPSVEELLEAAELAQGLTEGGADFGKDDIEIIQGLGTEPGESHQLNDANPADMQRESDLVDEKHAGKFGETDMVVDEGSNFQAEQDAQRPTVDVAEKEEGELLPEGSDVDGGDDMAINAGGQDVAEFQPEHTSASSMPSPARIDDDTYVSEANSPDISHAEQNEEGEVAEDIAEVSDKSTDGQDQIVGDVDNPSEVGSVAVEGNLSASVDSTISREDNPSMVTGTDETQSSHVKTGSRTINLSERAKERAAARLGRSPASASASAAATPATRRGRAPLARNRGGRGTRGGRRQTSGDQG